MNGTMELDLGTYFEIRLYDLAENKSEYSTEQFMAALQTTSTLTNLTVCLRGFTPTAEFDRRLVHPLCRCISNLRRHNKEHHPLRNVRLLSAKLVENGMLTVLEQILIAAKQFGIYGMDLSGVDDFPVHLLGEFCRNNNSLKNLTFFNVSLSATGTTLFVPWNDSPQDSTVILRLETLSLHGFYFRNATAASNFANMLAHMSVECLLLGHIVARNNIDRDDDDVARTERIVSKFKWPASRILIFLETCQLNHFKTALKAGTISVSLLYLFTVHDCFGTIDKNVSAKLNLLASFFRCTVKLRSLKIGIRVKPPLEFFEAIEACATITEIDWHSDDQISEGHDGIVTSLSQNVSERRDGIITSQDQNDRDAQHRLRMLTRGIMNHQEVATRNRNLENVLHNPSIFTAIKLLTFMRRFDNCPTGRYLLARCLPSVVPFQQLASSVRTDTKKRKWSIVS